MRHDGTPPAGPLFSFLFLAGAPAEARRFGAERALAPRCLLLAARPTPSVTAAERLCSVPTTVRAQCAELSAPPACLPGTGQGARAPARTGWGKRACAFDPRGDFPGSRGRSNAQARFCRGRAVLVFIRNAAARDASPEGRAGAAALRMSNATAYKAHATRNDTRSGGY